MTENETCGTNPQSNASLGCSATKQTKSSEIQAAIHFLKNTAVEIELLLMEIHGEACQPNERGNTSEPATSLAGTLECAPKEIYEQCEKIRQQLSGIRHALF